MTHGTPGIGLYNFVLASNEDLFEIYLSRLEFIKPFIFLSNPVQSPWRRTDPFSGAQEQWNIQLTRERNIMNFNNSI